jgi:hypothetical protein
MCVAGLRADRRGDVEVLAGEQLHRAELVARARDGDGVVEHRDAHHVELPHDREAVRRDRPDARDDQVEAADLGAAADRATACRG